jgi:phospholipid transport system substrate-binding protein
MFEQRDSELWHRAAVGLAMVAMTTATPWRPTLADAASTAPQAPIPRLDSALLAAMKSGTGTSLDIPHRMLKPVLDQVFNLGAVLEASLGVSWATMPDAHRTELAAAFRRHTAPSDVSNVDNYDGQKIEGLPSVRPVGDGELIVQTQSIRVDHSPGKLDYAIRQGPAGWQAVDVLTDGSTSRVAVQRSDFRELRAGGAERALAAGLERNAVSLSGRAV